MASLAEAYGVELTKQRIEIYEHALNDIPLSELEHAFESALKTCPRFPSVAEIRGQIQKAIERQDNFDAEKSWDDVRWTAREFWRGADLGIQPWCMESIPARYADRVEAKEFRGGFLIYPKPFDAHVDFAIRYVGGFDRIAQLADSEHDFVRRDFIQAYKRFSETSGYLAANREEAAQLMGILQKQLIEGEMTK